MSNRAVITDKTLFVLGAGVDIALGLPAMQNLLSELARFSVEEGVAIEKAIRTHVRGIRFNLRKRAGEQGEQFGELLLDSHSHLIDKIKSALDKHKDKDSPRIKAIREIVEKLESIRQNNQLDDETCRALGEIAGEVESESGGDFLSSPRGLTLTNTPRQAIRKVFQGALTEIEALTEQERDALKEEHSS